MPDPGAGLPRPIPLTKTSVVFYRGVCSHVASLPAHRGPTPGFGKSVSHSHRRTNRRWDPNIQTKRFWFAAENRFVRLRLSAKGIKTVDKIGVDAAVARIRAHGHRI